MEDLEMVKEIEAVTFTSFPNLDECDNDEALQSYLNRKARKSRRRVFTSIIQNEAQPFHPYDAMIRMPPVDFDVLCGLLKNYHEKRRWYWGIINKTEQEAMLKQLIKWRPAVDKSKEKEKDRHSSPEITSEGLVRGVKKLSKQL
ncbi:unnamed protein product [Didymodactylos carnosus]|uniref:Uncharacterized protein n=1 Tax=Didymodactylos carnosus TaxID=1234261 RepID=A0A814GVM1_9BILA|nr:unnamed protein product [Didymodactylos carnosus]CAF1001344.1 unnamed protein product [Didymodactylos carnosus]CAF3597486.1 unnamed protein product [Didymodactylos carnosus]CAF3772758.1 unnamed protein product [Didymodactylos carnosus]